MRSACEVGYPKIQLDIERIEEMAANGMSKEQIAAALGIVSRTLRNREKEDSSFSEAIKRGKARGIETVTKALMQQVQSRNIVATLFYLKCQAGWRENPDVESVKSDDPITSIELKVVRGKDTKPDDDGAAG